MDLNHRSPLYQSGALTGLSYRPRVAAFTCAATLRRVSVTVRKQRAGPARAARAGQPGAGRSPLRCGMGTLPAASVDGQAGWSTAPSRWRGGTTRPALPAQAERGGADPPGVTPHELSKPAAAPAARAPRRKTE